MFRDLETVCLSRLLIPAASMLFAKQYEVPNARRPPCSPILSLFVRSVPRDRERERKRGSLGRVARLLTSVVSASLEFLGQIIRFSRVSALTTGSCKLASWLLLRPPALGVGAENYR